MQDDENTDRGPNAAVGTVIRDRRFAKGMTQKELAAETLMATRTIIRAEHGHPIKSENMIAICSVLEIDPSQLDTAMHLGEAGDRSGEGEPRANPDGPRRILDVLRRKGIRVAFRRFTVAALFVGAAVGAGWSGIAREFTMTDRARKEISANVDFAMLRNVSGRINDIVLDRAGLRGAFPAETVVDMLAERNRDAVPCRAGDICVDGIMRGSSATLMPDGTYRLTLGPMTEQMAKGAMMTISRRPEVSVRIAVTPRANRPEEGILWFDPRGISPSQLPDFDGLAFLQVDISPVSGAST